MPAGQLYRLTIQRMVERLLGAGLIETHHPSVNDLSDSVADQVRLLKKGLREHKDNDVPGAYLYYKLTPLGQIVLLRGLKDSGVNELLKEHPVLFKAFVKWGERFGPKSNP